MYKPILNENEGIIPNLDMCIDNYKRTPKERSMWVEEFGYWYRIMNNYSMIVAQKYRTKFERVRNEPIDLFD